MFVRRATRLASAAILLGGVFGVGLTAAPAFGAAMTGHGVTTIFDFGASGMTGAFNLNAGPPFDAFDPVAAGCPFDDTVAFVIVGNGVDHMSGNKNGFWAGGTATGPTTLEASDGTPLYLGQATGWGGIGTNIGGSDETGQFEVGETFHFHGVAADPENPQQTVDVTLSYHATVNNNGSLTNMKESLSCR